MKPKISVVLITKNEEKNIAGVLKNMSWVDEIIIVDDFSTDKTCEIAKKYGAKIYSRKLDDFASQRNFSLSKIKTEWTFWIDADERLPKKLIDEIKVALKKPSFDGYYFYRNDYFMNTNIAINKKLSVDKLNLRLFKTSKAKFVGRVHEELILDGKISQQPFKYAIEHYSYDNISQWVKKMELYTRLDAEKILEKKGKKSTFWIITKSFLEFHRQFLGQYIYYGLFRKGFVGFIWCILAGWYKVIVYFKYYELIKK